MKHPHILFMVLLVGLGACKEEVQIVDVDDLARMDSGGVTELPADGASTIVIRLVLDARTDTSIKTALFTTDRGSFPGGATYLATIRSDRTASATLTSGREAGPCSVTAEVATLTLAHELELVTARPHSIQLSLSTYTVDTMVNAPVTIMLQADRTIGAPSEGQSVVFSFAPDTSAQGLVLPGYGNIDELGRCSVVVDNPFKRVGVYQITARMIGAAGDTLHATRTLQYE
ncbi:MAG: hypothetical protein IPJ87_01950 [Flavobacteriales bacterium]|nr:hypothetical protein [Flavobacteriales bacterium]MBK7940636.1 hypothetical protein [Flavobacteriales bacterium]MBK8950374.1 hypothetical protein [Flavobacteriales bacterium]MBK9700944.1 hypothetical protein [Flavobacteriales bacterium]